MMDGFYHAWQTGVMRACLGMLGLMAVGIILYGFGQAWGKVREWWSLPLIERVLAGVFVVGFAYYGSTKHGAPSVRWDDGLADNGTLITNDTVSVRWTYSGIPGASSVFIDYREAGTTNEWLNLAETLASAQEWTGTLANATNYDYWVYSTYVPPVPVHTNGVWVGQAYETKAKVGAAAFLILNGKVVADGRTIAPPKRTKLVGIIEWTDGYRYISDGSRGGSAGKSVTDTYIPIVGGHAYTVFCGSGGTANRYAHVYGQGKSRIESVNETKANATFTFTANVSAAFLRYTCNTDSKATTYVHDDTDNKYIVQNGVIL